jgi:hypothetical protein
MHSNYSCMDFKGSFTGRKTVATFLNKIMNLPVVCFLLGSSTASEFYIPTFQNTLSVPSSQAGRYEDYLSAC